jgi:hypothetical protein
VPGRLGKNCDQIQRLFDTDADLFFIQHWREIDQCVVIAMAEIAKALSTRRMFFYGVIDGQDSAGIYKAYPSAFSRARKRSGRGVARDVPVRRYITNGRGVDDATPASFVQNVLQLVTNCLGLGAGAGTGRRLSFPLVAAGAV